MAMPSAPTETERGEVRAGMWQRLALVLFGVAVGMVGLWAGQAPRLGTSRRPIWDSN